MKSFASCYTAPLNRLAWAVLLLAALLFFWADPCQAQEPLLDVKLYAHRGLHIEHPENSLGAIQAALDSGIHGAEIDLRTTRDGVIILMHDPILDKTTNACGKVRETDYAEIQALHLKSAQGKITEWTVPTFEQALKLVKKRPGFELALDPKDVDAVAAACLVLKFDMANQVQFFIADPKNVELVRSIKNKAPRLKICVDMLNWWKIEDVPSFAAASLEADYLFASEWFFPNRGFEELSKRGAPVIVYLWGAHDLKKRFDHAVSLGALGVSCDNPLELLPYVRPLPAKK
ncbi:glycerophosphoryl diester phosphodiesterase [Desulfatibacillum aliphaticivorans]|uniref:Glycerophosphoryl diester phosphodiesterase n=1 Tax=Desulfatibacillum aliphaticivorans TaxID=218208 RepID=B8FM21_DESAL|nr:glycerophosphodiester phosphodiesterase family protein [Desulfatibacillum aliphaticivorans]ACL05754.1 glycerophosphoryl diester phosphodiesterase [Desulfatibacillum aliphaticivorans]